MAQVKTRLREVELMGRGSWVCGEDDGEPVGYRGWGAGSAEGTCNDTDRGQSMWQVERKGNEPSSSA